MEAITDFDVNTDAPAWREVIQAIKSLKNGKAPGHDNLNVELFKTHPELVATILIPLFAKIWELEEIPLAWTRGVATKIPKKGSLNYCNSWWGITLLSVPSKMFCSASPELLMTSCEMNKLDFVKGVGVGNKFLHSRNILEHCTEWNRQLYINFIDYEKAFDRIHRNSLWQILRAYGIPQRIVLRRHQMLLFKLYMLCW